MRTINQDIVALRNISWAATVQSSRNGEINKTASTLHTIISLVEMGAYGAAHAAIELGTVDIPYILSEHKLK